MEQIIIHGGHKLQGTVKIEGGKNAALPILAATILTEGITVLKNVPILSDVLVMNEILRQLNVNVEFTKQNEVTVDSREEVGSEAKYELVSRIRASILVMGPLLARNGYAKVAATPGGCAIGKRPIDLHLKGFKALGATIIQKNGYIEAFADKLIGNKICLDLPSVGATQNIMMAAVKAEGTTVITNAAKEPEIVDLASILNKMGAKIFGAGSEVIEIRGVSTLNGVEFTIEQDRCEAGTFMIAAAMTEGDVLVEKSNPEHNKELITKLRETGTVVREEINGIRVIGAKVFNSVDITTSAHPGFPTDLQAPMTAMLITAKGTSIVTETVFEDRFQHFKEMQAMGADIRIKNNMAIIQGSETSEIVGTDVEASDLRSAAALILAGLKANGETRVTNLEHLDRGYYRFHEKLKELGARIKRVRLS